MLNKHHKAFSGTIRSSRSDDPTYAEVRQHDERPGHWLLLRLGAPGGPSLGLQGLLLLVQAGQHQHIRHQALPACRTHRA